jgi:hypothetical protein
MLEIGKRERTVLHSDSLHFSVREENPLAFAVVKECAFQICIYKRHIGEVTLLEFVAGQFGSAKVFM